MSSLRRLPFNGPEGSPAYTPDTNPNGMLAKLADAIETRQLETGQTVLTLSSAGKCLRMTTTWSQQKRGS